MTNKSKRIIVFLLVAACFGLTSLTALAAPVAQLYPCEQDYIVQAGDWLSTIAETVYGDPLAYTVIVDATNLAARGDPAYTAITDPAVIEIGARLCIPDQADATALLARQAAMQQGESAVEKGKMLLIMGNRSQQQMAAAFTLSGGQFETPQSFDIPAGHEVQLQLTPGDYQIQWATGQGMVSRDFQAVADVITIAWAVPEAGEIFAENQWAGLLGGSPRGKTELGWPHLPSVQDTYTPYHPPLGKAMLVAGNVSQAEIYARLTLAGGQFDQGQQFVVNPGQEILFLVDPGTYQVTWETLDGSLHAGYTLTGEVVVAADEVGTVWIRPEDHLGVFQKPGLPAEALR